MKKIIATILIASSYSSTSFSTFFSIDSIYIMQNSKEGKALFAEFEKEKENAINKLKALEKDLIDQQEILQKQSALLSPDITKEKVLELQRKEKNLTRQRDELAEELNNKFQPKQERLITSHIDVAKRVFEAKDVKGKGVLIDVKTPGVLAVGRNTSITDEVLKAVNDEYDAAQKKAAQAKSAALTKTTTKAFDCACN